MTRKQNRPLVANPVIPNGLLHEYVTRTGFDLSLGKTHIAALVVINEARLNPGYRPETHHEPAFRFWVPATQGLRSRGLAEHHWPGRDRPFAWYHRLTKAGILVADLLKEAGLYDQYASKIPEWRKEEYDWEGNRIA